jgi:uncharacterized protein DUF4082/Big-like domain-containing protein
VPQRCAHAPSPRIDAARAVLILTVLLLCAASVRAHAALADPGADDGGPWALFGAGIAPSESPAGDTETVELGVRFSVAEPQDGHFRVTAVRFDRAASRPMVENRVFVYDDAGEAVARGVYIGEGGATGVVEVPLQEPLTLRPGVTYTASYLAPAGGYSYESGAFAGPVAVGPITFPAEAGVFTYGGGFPRDTWDAASYYVSPVIELDTGASAEPPPPAPRDATVPNVAIVDPSDGATVPADTAFYVRARLADDGGVMREVRLLIDGTVVDTFPIPGTAAP